MSTIDEKLNDDIISSKTIRTFKNQLFKAGVVTTDFSSEAEKKGNAILVPSISEMVASTTENDYETDTSGIGKHEILLNKYAKVTIGLTDKQFADSSSANLERFAEQAAETIAAKVINDIFASIFASKAQCGAMELDISKLAGESGTAEDLHKLLSEAGMPTGNRGLLASPALWAGLLKGNQSLITASALSQSKDNVMIDGNLPSILGMSINETNLLPIVSGPDKFTGVAMHQSGVAIAIRALQPSDKGAYAECRIITDKPSGLAMTYRRHYAPGKGKQYITFEAVYGVTVCNPKAIILIEDVVKA